MLNHWRFYNMEYNENCKSCNEFNNSRCPFVNYNKHNECPCTVCLIKTMCKKPCEAFDKFKSYIKSNKNVVIL